LHPAYRTGRTIFASRVYEANEVARVLKDGHQSRKIGKIVQKGPRRGWPIFTLTLEERATCPRSCAAWAFCYGNNMHAAQRIAAGDLLEDQIDRELAALQEAHPGGFLVRLHVLGDFYSVEYVDAWACFLALYPALHVFGFTAHPVDTPIGAALNRLVEADWNRFAVRFSGRPGPVRASRIAGDADSDAIPCPAQTGATTCCATCALCWATDRSISFRRH
jgi:hypothetical protein